MVLVKDMNYQSEIFVFVSTADWGADGTVLLSLCVRSIESLYVEVSEPSLEDRHIRLGVRCATELRAYPSSPACDCVFSPLYEDVCDKQPNAVQPFGL